MTVEEFVEISICRICLEEECSKNLINPCSCKGSMGKVHISCLENWIRVKDMEKCEVCNQDYRIQRILKYGKLGSLLPFIQIQKFTLLNGILRIIVLFVLIAVENIIIAFIYHNWWNETINLFVKCYYLIVWIFLYYFFFLECICEIHHIYHCWRSWRTSIFTICLL